MKHQLVFRSFRFDPVNERVWRGTQVVSLRPKTFAVLRYLIEHAGQLVTKEELFDAIWPETSVSDVVPIVCVRELRKALGDQPDAPQYIETVPRRGYRFIAPLTVSPVIIHNPPPGGYGRKIKFRTHPLRTKARFSKPPLVDRDAELALLYGWLEKAVRGERRVVFVTGEPGIGKTALLETFIERAATYGMWIGYGQCIEHYGAGEAYLPILDALGRLCRQPGGGVLIELLSQYAPTWLVQMPTLLNASDLDALQRRIQGATKERMLREMAEALEVLTTERPLVLVLEDLHWGDYATLDLISFLARRREPARLLLIGTYRSAEVTMSGHPLRSVVRELHMHRQCEELPIGLLGEAAVAAYLGARFPVRGQRTAPLQELARRIHRRTDGNPLFMVNVVEYLVAQGLVAHCDGQWELKEGIEEAALKVPESIRRMIEKQIDHLSVGEQRVLEVASVAGAQFSAAAVAAVLEVEPVEIEGVCEGLTRREQFLQPDGIEALPSGVVTARYSFIHSLYQNVLYDRVATARRVRVHRQIGEWGEVAYGDRAGERAAELAVHFEEGRDYHRAVEHLRQASENATRRYVYREAVRYLTRGLDLLNDLPDTAERTRQELVLRTALGSVLIAQKGWGAPEVEQAYSRARELYEQVGETPQLFPVVWGLWASYFSRGEIRTASEHAAQLLTLAQQEQDSGLLMLAHHAVGATLFYGGELATAQQHHEQGFALYNPQQHNTLIIRSGVDIRVGCLGFSAWTFQLLGYADRAMQRVREALSVARELSHPHSLAIALFFATGIHQARGEISEAQRTAEELIGLSREQGLPFFLAIGTISRGQALVGQGQTEEGIAQICAGMAECRAAGAELGRTGFLGVLARAYQKAGRIEEGLAMLDEAVAVVQRTAEQNFEAELYRLKGELTLAQSSVANTLPPTPCIRAEAEAEVYFHKAMDTARRQGAKFWELRAAMSLRRLLREQGKKREAHHLLAEVYQWFTEGFDTADLQGAQAVLQELEDSRRE